MKIAEIFKSIQGESTYAGRPCLFIRTTGCNLRCSWCDTTYAFHEGVEMPLEEVKKRVEEHGGPLVEITGGEPLIQPEVYPLVTWLLDRGNEVLIETSGSLPIDRLDSRAVVIMDIKCPGSGMGHAVHWDNVEHLRPKDEVKFVIADRRDFLFAKETCEAWNLFRRCHVLFSPVFEKLSPRVLAEWILEESLPARLQIQIHKYIWDPAARGV
jgi:7-carboxy-7-deazaguanine synthase